MSISLYNLSKRQTNIMKAIAIILIVLHNFLHFLSNIGENEMFFDPNRINRLFQTISNSSSIWVAIKEAISFFGWVGILFFIFISGYGLAKTYLNQENFNLKDYYIHHAKKLLALYLFAHILHFLFISREFDWTELYEFIVLTVLLPFKNLNASLMYRYQGPFWYFSLAAQLYIVFPIILFCIRKYGKKLFPYLFILSYIVAYGLIPLANKIHFPVYGNITGHLPEFLLGIFIAYSPNFKLKGWMFLTALFIAVVANFYTYLYPLFYLAALGVMLFIFYPLYHSPSPITIVSRILTFIGKISMFMFIINPIIREAITLEYAINASPQKQLILSIIHFAIVILASYLLSILYTKIGEAISYTVHKFSKCRSSD